ncbi:DoxX family membrane protein [Flavobacterium procerum]|uniref:DoxX family membrane protein n=1 Tax=Flavobacterium procerum TaxID=1455569 RepID=A0ABV6BN39_9FLAO
MFLPWHLYLMALLYLLAGINHFRKPGMYIKIIPPVFKNPKLLNYLSGGAEIILSVLLVFPFTSPFAAWGIILLLIAVFPANLYMFQNKKVSFGLPNWILFVRLPLQLILMYWAYLYTF